MAEIKSATEIAEKWSRVTPQRQADYDAGVKSPLKSWQSGAEKAKDSWAAGVQSAISNDMFSKGVRKAGDAKWSRKTIEVGIGRWGPGVRAAGQDYADGFAPYQQVISGITLPPRYPKGDPRNIDRVAAIANALHAKKVSG